MLSLLSNSAGMALIIACAIVPILILLTLNQRDVFESESPLVLAGVTIAGAWPASSSAGLARSLSLPIGSTRGC